VWCFRNFQGALVRSVIKSRARGAAYGRRTGQDGDGDGDGEKDRDGDWPETETGSRRDGGETAAGTSTQVRS